jgi:hypothetical protein
MLKHMGSLLMSAAVLMIVGCADSRGSGQSKRYDSPPRATQGADKHGRASDDSVFGDTRHEQNIFTAFTKQESEFRQHYDRHFADSGYGYNQFRPAYQHGFELGFDPHYRDMDWPAIEQEARRGWDEARMGQWDRYQDAVRYGWERGVLAARA